jgi:hypothetical protein
VPERVGEPPAEAERCRQRQQVGVVRPLHLVADRPSSRWMCGTAIEMMVWSKNVIDTAKIIAARIRFRGRPSAVVADVMTTPRGSAA